MSLPDLLAAKAYVDGSVLTEQDLDDLFLDELDTKYFNQLSVTLADNTSSVDTVFSVSAATNTVVAIEYSITRGSGNIEAGSLYMVNDGTNADVAGSATSLGTMGITFSADVNAGNVRLRFVSTSTGQAATFRYRQWTWVA